MSIFHVLPLDGRGHYLPDGCYADGLSESDARALAAQVAASGYEHEGTFYPACPATTKPWRDYKAAQVDCAAKCIADRTAEGKSADAYTAELDALEAKR